MFLNVFKRNEAEKIKRDRIRWIQKALPKIPKLKKLIEDPSSGWPEYVDIIQNYISACKKRKAITALDIADDATIAQLKMLDHEVWILETMVIGCVGRFIKKTERKIEEQRKADEEGMKQEPDFTPQEVH